MVVRFVCVVCVPLCVRVPRVSRVCPGSPRYLFTDFRVKAPTSSSTPMNGEANREALLRRLHELELQRREASLKLTLLTKRSNANSAEESMRAPARAASAPAAPAAKRPRLSAFGSSTSQPIAQVTLGGSTYEVMQGGRSLRRAGSEASSTSEAVTNAAKAAVAAAQAAQAAADALKRYVAAAEAAGGGSSTGAETRPSRAHQQQYPQPEPQAASQPARKPAPHRHVSVPGAAFEPTANGMGLQRRRTDGSAATGALLVRGAPTRTCVDFQRQRRVDEARAAKGAVLCTQFCRFGFCSREGSECHYAHDPLRTAICQPFLHGRCKAPAPCALSHEPAAERMPVCRLYQRGLCVASQCEFSHIHRGASATLCDAFSRAGYCPEGDTCTRRHELFCELAQEDACPLGDRCKLGRPGVGAGAGWRMKHGVPALRGGGDLIGATDGGGRRSGGRRSGERELEPPEPKRSLLERRG
jgi:hypothetical protein